MRTFVCTVFWCVCLQIQVLLPPSWVMAALLCVAVIQDYLEIKKPEKGSPQ